MGENRHFRIIEKAIKFIKENFDSNLKLAEISEHVGMSDYHFQRSFYEMGRDFSKAIFPIFAQRKSFN